MSFRAVREQPSYTLTSDQALVRDAYRLPSGSATPKATPNLDIGRYLRDNPRGSLRDIVVAGDEFKAGSRFYTVVAVKDKKLEAETNGERTTFILERDANKEPIGLKQKATKPAVRPDFS